LIQGQSHRIRYVVYDEAHEWLVDWRADLLKCPEIISELLPNATIFACTATCSTEDMPCLLKRLRISEPAIHRLSVDRSNCFLRVVPSKDEKADIEFIFDRIKVQPASLVFVVTKKEAEEFAASLKALCTTQEFSGDHIAYFHSDLPAANKKRIILAFLEGTIRCVVATQAFGTGLNLPCIRLVINRCLCAKIATYLQNIGRGGRDGGPYECILMFSYTMIYDCGKVWLNDASDTEIQTEWTRFQQMISYPMSLKCRRAHLLPLFDAAFNAESVCEQCDNCIARIAGVVPVVDVTKAARLLLEVISESIQHTHTTVSMSRIRDIMLGWKPRDEKFASDQSHTRFGCAKEAGFKQSPQLWMLLSSYMLYAVTPPLLSETVTRAGEHIISRHVTITPTGRDFLENCALNVSIRMPIEYADMQLQEVDLLFNPGLDIRTKACSIAGCAKAHYSKGLCKSHYQQDLRGRPKTLTASLPTSQSTDSTNANAASLAVSVPNSDSISTASLEQSSDCANGVFYDGLFPPATLPGSVERRELGHDSSTSSSSAEDYDGDDPQLYSSFDWIDPETTKELMQYHFYPGGFDPAITEVHILPDGQRSDQIGWALTSHHTRTSFAEGCKIRHVSCAGCLVCPDPVCPFIARPFSRGVATKVCGNIAHHDGHPPQLTLQKCTAKFSYSTNLASGIVTLTATGHLPHARPPPKRPCEATMAVIHQQMIVSGKKPSSSQLLMSSPAVSQDAGAQDATRLQRQVNRMFKDMYGCDLGMTGLGHLSTLLEHPFVRETQVAFGTSSGTNFDFIYCQLDEQIRLAAQVANAHKNSQSTTTNFLYADVEYMFGTMYKMAIMTQSLESGKGVVLAIIFVTRLHAAAYQRIFLAFFHNNPSLWTVIGGELAFQFEACLVDFSDSQRSGFLQAVEALWREKFAGDFSAALRQSFAAKLKGCYFHYCQSVKSCCHNSRVVPSGMGDEFNRFAQIMYTATTMTGFNAAVTSIAQRFPRASKWLAWWTAPSHAGLIFPAFRNSELGEELSAFHNMPTTNNFLESHNRKIKRFIAYREMPPVIAVHDAFKYCVMEVRELDAIRTGLSKVNKRERGKLSLLASRKEEYPLQGRAPQTFSEFGGQPTRKSALEQPSGSSCVSRHTSHITRRTTYVTLSFLDAVDDVLRALLDKIRAEGLPSGSIVQCKNTTLKEKWCVQGTYVGV
jgi:hypothetical protein